MKKLALATVTFALLFAWPVWGAQLSFDIKSTELPSEKVVIEEDVASQFTVFDKFFGDNVFKNTKIEVYSSYLEIPRYVVEADTIRIVAPNDYAAEVGKTRPAFDEFMRAKWPNIGTGTREIISAYLSSVYLGLDSSVLAAASRLAFNDIKVPKDPDMGGLHPSIVDRACAAIGQLGEKRGEKEQKNFILRSLEVGISKSCSEFFGGDFRSFVRGVATPLPKQELAELLVEIETLRGKIWAGMPERPVPADYEKRKDAQIKLEQARVLVAKQEPSKIGPLFKQIEDQLDANGSQQIIWWVAGFLGLVAIGVFFVFLLKSAIRYGNQSGNKKPLTDTKAKSGKRK